MPKSLRAKLSKLRHDEHITDAEYQELKKKLDGHDRELRNRVIDEFAEKVKEGLDCTWCNSESYRTCMIAFKADVDSIARQMKEGRA